MITTAELRLFLHQNPNALVAKRIIPQGTELSPGLYWNLKRREVEVVERPRQASDDCVRLSDHLDATLAQVSRTFALGSGGPVGTPQPLDKDLVRHHGGH